jgi:hypothetical protein
MIKLLFSASLFIVSRNDKRLALNKAHLTLEKHGKHPTTREGLFEEIAGPTAGRDN